MSRTRSLKYVMSFVLFFFLLASYGFAETRESKEKPKKVLIIEEYFQESTEDSMTQNRIVVNMIEEYIYKRNDLEQVDRDKVNSLREKFQLEDLTEIKAFTIGEESSWDWIIISSLDLNELEYEINLKLYSIKSKEILYMSTKKISSIEEFKPVVSGVISEMFEVSTMLDGNLYMDSDWGSVVTVYGSDLWGGDDAYEMGHRFMVETGLSADITENGDLVYSVPGIFYVGVGNNFTNSFAITFMVMGGGVSYSKDIYFDEIDYDVYTNDVIYLKNRLDENGMLIAGGGMTINLTPFKLLQFTLAAFYNYQSYNSFDSYNSFQYSQLGLCFAYTLSPSEVVDFSLFFRTYNNYSVDSLGVKKIIQPGGKVKVAMFDSSDLVLSVYRCIVVEGEQHPQGLYHFNIKTIHKI
ncbi:MAG: hypothetical protein GY754_27230 [bacterium]|nr:hypothetical protein [bacterium]